VILGGCQGVIGGPVDDAPSERVDEPGDDPVESGGSGPVVESVGDAEFEETRDLRRLTADQFARSLEVATGERWRDFDRFASTLGQPDLVEVLEDGTGIGVAFVKLVTDGARSTCSAAVDADLRRSSEQRVILRHAGPSDASFDSHVANLRYLLMRFWFVDVPESTDPRLTPWLGLLSAPRTDGREMTDDDRVARWKAVCIGLATHPDFLSY
jgi:hypothetical protein